MLLQEYLTPTVLQVFGELIIEPELTSSNQKIIQSLDFSNKSYGIKNNNRKLQLKLEINSEKQKLEKQVEQSTIGKMKELENELNKRIKKQEQGLERQISSFNKQSFEVPKFQQIIHKVPENPEEIKGTNKNQWSEKKKNQESKRERLMSREHWKIIEEHLERKIEVERIQANKKTESIIKKLRGSLVGKEKFKKIQTEMKEQIEILNGKVNRLMNNVSKILKEKKNTEKQKTESYQPILKKLSQIDIEKMEKSIDFITPYAKYFKVKDNKITLEKKDEEWIQILSTVNIKKQGVFQFYSRVMQTKHKLISIGVVDINQQRNAKKSCISGNAVCYQGWIGRIFYGSKGKYEILDDGNGFDIGEWVKTEVNLEKGQVTWTLGEKKVTIYSPILQETDRVFVPYFQMYNKNDSIEWFYK